jgi:hypothetical protein
MLNKKETALMREIYRKTTNNNGMCLVRPVELMKGIPYNVEFDKCDLVPTLQGLVYDEYFELVETDKKGEYYFCITLLKKGFAFLRNEELRLRTRRAKIIGSVIQKIILTLIGVGLGFLLKQLIALLNN